MIVRMKINNIIFFLLITILLVHGIDNHIKNKNSNDNSDVKESYYDRVLPTTVNYITNFYNIIFNNNNEHELQQQRQLHMQEQQQRHTKTGQHIGTELEDIFLHNTFIDGKADRKLQADRNRNNYPTFKPTPLPTLRPTPQPTLTPTSRPTGRPTSRPSSTPTARPTAHPTKIPTPLPTFKPSPEPSPRPTPVPTSVPTSKPTSVPTSQPSSRPTSIPSSEPTSEPTSQPSRQPTSQPSRVPSSKPTSQPSCQPSRLPTMTPTTTPSSPPSSRPTSIPSSTPTSIPTSQPTLSLGYDDDKWFLRNTSPEGFWTSVSSDRKGRVVAATQAGTSVMNGGIYISTNYGKNWGLSTAPMNLWSSISVSETGQYMVAIGAKFEDLVLFKQDVSTSSAVYLSSNYGETWSPILPTGHYGDVKMIDSGKIGIIAYNSHTSTASKILLTDNYGSTWIEINASVLKQGQTISVNGNSFLTGPPFLYKIVGSRSGQYIVTIESSTHGRIFKTSDGGQNWNVVNNMIGPWSSLAVDYSGKYLVAGQGYTKVIYEPESSYTQSGYLYRSSDFGESWQRIMFFDTGVFSDIVSDSTGKFLSLVYESEPDFYSIYVSSNYGETWAIAPDVPISKDYSIASSGYGRFLYACSKERASSVPSRTVKGRISMYRGMAEPEIPLY